MTTVKSKPLAYRWCKNDEMQMVACVATHPKLWALFGHSLNPACVSTEGAILLLKVARYAAEFGDSPLQGVDGFMTALRKMYMEDKANREELWAALDAIWEVEDTTFGSLDNGLLAGLHCERWAQMACSEAERQAARFQA